MDLSEKYIQSSYFLLKHLEPESEDDVIDTKDGKKYHRMGLFDDKGNQVDDYDYFRIGDGVYLDYMADEDGNEGFRFYDSWGKLEYNPIWHEVFATKPTPIYSAKYQKKEEKEMSEFKCPKCGSTDIQWNEPLRYYSYQQCLKCGHRWNEALESYRSFEKLLDSIGIAAAKQIGDRKDTEDDLKDLDEEFETYVRTPKKAEFKQLASALGNTATETYKGIKLEVKNLKEKISHTATIQFKNGRGEAIIVIRFEPSEKDYEWWHKKMVQDLDAETNEQFIDNVKSELEYWVYWFMVEQDFFRRAKEGGFKRGMPFKGEKGEEEND